MKLTSQTEQGTLLAATIQKILGTLIAIAVIVSFGGSMMAMGIFATTLRRDVDTQNTKLSEIMELNKSLASLIENMEPANQRFSRDDAQSLYNRSYDSFEAGKPFWLAKP